MTTSLTRRNATRGLAGAPAARTILGALTVTALTAMAAPAPAGAQAGGSGPSDPEALEIARRVTAAVGGEAWKSTGFIHFKYHRRGNVTGHTWDKPNHRYRLEGTNGEGQAFVTMIDLNTREGHAFVDGQPLEGEALDQALNMAFGAWHGSNYWSLMPNKLLDPGVILRREAPETIDGTTYDVLHLSFDNVGLTPDDQFWVFVNPETDLPDRWRFRLGQGAEGEFLWKAWQEHGGLRIATIRERMDGTTEIELTGIVVTDSLPETWFTSPEPVAALTP